MLTVWRTAAESRSVLWRETAGSVAVAIDTPNSPIGKVHQPEGVVQPGHRAFDCVGREQRVDEHVDLRRRHADGARSHQRQHAPQSFVPPVDFGVVPEALLVQCGPLQRQLRHAAEQRADGDRGNGLQAERGHQRNERERTDDRHHVEHRRRERRDEVVMERVQHAHERGGQRDQRQRGHHDARELNRQREFGRFGRVLLRGKGEDQRLGEHDSENHQAAGHDDERIDDVIAQPPRRLFAGQREISRERGHEGRAHRAFGKQIPEEVGNAECDVIRVSRGAGPEERRDDLLADDAEDAARHRGDSGRCGRSR